MGKMAVKDCKVDIKQCPLAACSWNHLCVPTTREGLVHTESHGRRG